MTDVVSADVSISAVSATPTPPVSLPTTATPAEVLANNATFQSQLQTYSDAEQAAPALYNTLPTTQVLGGNANDAFAASLTDTLLNPALSTFADTNNTFPSYLVDTYLAVSSAPTPNPFGATLSGLALDTSGFAVLPASPNPFAQHGVGINVSVLQ